MAKCPICNSKKGKRKCLITESFICSLCCGITMKVETCLGCEFYQKPKRKYNKVPAYLVSEMDGNMELEGYGNTIEGALCSYDIKIKSKIKDSETVRIVELLIDKYYFNDQQIDTTSQLIKNGVKHVDAAIHEDLKNISNEEIVKTLGVILFVAKRRTRNGREYMKIIHQYVGERIGTGIRIVHQ